MPKCHQVVLDIRKVDQCHLLQVFSRVTHLATKVVGSHKESKGTKTVWFPRFLGSSETVAKGPNKFDEIFHGVKPEIRAGFFLEKTKTISQMSQPTAGKYHYCQNFSEALGEKVFSKNGSFLWFFYLFPTRITYLKKRYQMLPFLCKQRFLPFFSIIMEVENHPT